MATELVPAALESPRVELVWKYLIPAPLASAFSVLRPLEVEVERAVTLLALVLMPLEAEVDSAVTLLALVLIPLEADVDSETTLLLVVDRPLESEVTPL